MFDANCREDEKFPLYSECEKKRAFDKNHFIKDLPNFIKKPFPVSFFMQLLELEEKLLKNAANNELLDQSMSCYSVISSISALFLHFSLIFVNFCTFSSFFFIFLLFS